MALSESPRGWWLGSVTTPTTGLPHAAEIRSPVAWHRWCRDVRAGAFRVSGPGVFGRRGARLYQRGGVLDRLSLCNHGRREVRRTEENTDELQSLMRISYAVFCLRK